MQEPVICKLSDISREQWQIAFDKAMAATDFDGLFHRLYLATEPNWYTGPESARKLAERLFESAMKNIAEGFVFNRPNIHNIGTGCLKLEFFVYEGNFQCHINFDAVTAHGLGFVYR